VVHKPEGEISSKQSFIVMKPMGKNLENIKKMQEDMLTLDLSIALIVQMLDSIDSVHSRGFIHRDIKPSNFVIGKGEESSKVFIIDFGLAKKHLQNNVPMPKRKQADFRGTITFASLNTHLRKDLSRRDDLWSFYFVILYMLNVNLPWKSV
jgi:serine/threonine protein kinase